MPPSPRPPSKAHSSVNPDVYDCVCKLAAHPLVTVMIFSGTDRFKLCETFGNTPNIWLAAENGVFVRPPLDEVDGGSISESDEWVMTVPNINKDWRDSVQLVFEYFSERTPRSFVEVSVLLPLIFSVRSTHGNLL